MNSKDGVSYLQRMMALINWRGWIPSRGNTLFTLVMAGALVWTQQARALPSSAPTIITTSTSTIAYQGRLADSAGTPLNATITISFRLYATAVGSSALWVESQTVQVTNGLFNVLLGSTAPIPQTIITSNSTLWLGIAVAADPEMTPRVQIGSAPYAIQALTVPDGSIMGTKLAPDIMIPMVPHILAYINKNNWVQLNSNPNGTPQTIETITFNLPAAPAGYRWDLEWRFGQRFGAIDQQSVYASFLLDGLAIRDSSGVGFDENASLSVQFVPMDNIIFGGTVYQNNIASGSHTLTWQMGAFGEPSNIFATRQRWLVLSRILVPTGF
jgi:hypothetical protein